MAAPTSSNRMTEGPIGKKIIKFALPLFLGNLFQQLYNVADTLIVGNLLGNQALAAVSSTGSLIFVLVGFFGGDPSLVRAWSSPATSGRRMKSGCSWPSIRRWPLALPPECWS